MVQDSTNENKIASRNKFAGIVYCVFSVGIAGLTSFTANTLIPALIGISALLMVLGLYHLNILRLSRKRLRNKVTGMVMFIVISALFAWVLGTV